MYLVVVICMLIIAYIVCLLLFSYSDTRWDGSDIVVLNDVKICSPYTNCQGNNIDLQKRLQAMVRNFDNNYFKAFSIMLSLTSLSPSSL